MDLEEANFILNQLTISQPCISGYMCITADQIDEAVEVINTELEQKNLKIKQLEKELNKREKKENIIKYDKTLKQYFNVSKSKLAMN